jgi:dTDP-4-amino-4,6-dideoxygalactose transaminase
VKNGAWYEHHRLGSNLRMSAVNAAMLIPQIDTLESEMDLRDKNRATLDRTISEIKGLTSM